MDAPANETIVENPSKIGQVITIMQGNSEFPNWVGEESTWEPMSDEMRAKCEALRKQHMEELGKVAIQFLGVVNEDDE